MGSGALLMEYLPGSHLEYEKDYKKAAIIFSKIHVLEPSPDLIVQSSPVFDIAGESLSLITRHADHPLKEEGTKLLNYHEKVMKLGEETETLFRNESMCMVNTEVNSHNFLVSRDSAFLVEWVKSVVSYRSQDLGHFLVPTTTLWKSDHIFSDEQRIDFLKTYNETAATGIPLDEISRKTLVLEKTILLRGLSWCYMAYYEYTETERSLRNTVTFNRIKKYLTDIDWFLKTE